MDTYFRVEWGKCKKCYKCIEKCKEKNAPTGNLEINICDGEPEYRWDYVSCHHCDYICEKLCPNDAIKIERW